MHSTQLKGIVVGAGAMGQNHARQVAIAPDLQLLAVVDPDPARRKAVAERYGTTGVASLEDALKLKPDFAIIASPNVFHAEQGVHALGAGVPVLIEKPIASTLAEADRLIAAAEQASRILMVGQVERFNPVVTAALSALEGERIASLSITRIGPYPARMAEIGVVLDISVHDIDLVRFLTGEDIAGFSAVHHRVRGPKQDVALMTLQTYSGTVAVLHDSWLSPERRRLLEIATANRLVVADLITRQVTVSFDLKSDGSYCRKAVFVAQEEPLAVELRAFVDAIRRGGPSPVSGEDGRRTLEIALSATLDNNLPSL